MSFKYYRLKLLSV